EHRLREDGERELLIRSDAVADLLEDVTRVGRGEPRLEQECAELRELRGSGHPLRPSSTAVERENPWPSYEGQGSWLPGLDSNQEPAGFKPSPNPIASLAERRAAKEVA